MNNILALRVNFHISFLSSDKVESTKRGTWVGNSQFRGLNENEVPPIIKGVLQTLDETMFLGIIFIVAEDNFPFQRSEML